jgi:hypothetical protein
VKLLVEADVRGPSDLLQGIADRFDNPRGALTLLGGLLADYEREVFATRGLGRWPADDPATVRLKNSGRVLVQTGGLLENLTDAHIEGDSVVVNSGDSKQAAYLKRGARGMPPRDPAPMPDHGRVQDWAEQVLGYLIDGRR